MLDSAQQQINRIAWFEVPATDSHRARKFYGELLEWTFQPSEHDYHMTFEGGGAVYGAQEPGILAYFGVSDLSAHIERVTALGGQAGEPQEIPGFGHYAVCVDTEGNRFGLLESAA